MNEPDFQPQSPASGPKTSTVLALLAVISAVFSYLGAYAMANALVAAEMIRPWSADHDPRFLWFLIGFVVLLGIFLSIGVAARYVSARNLKQIDAMEDAPEQESV